jgi:hypothetical protein
MAQPYLCRDHASKLSEDKSLFASFASEKENSSCVEKAEKDFCFAALFQ